MASSREGSADGRSAAFAGTAAYRAFPVGASMPWLPALGGVGAQLLRCLCVARGAAREPRLVGRHRKGTSMPVISMTLGRRRALFTRLLAELIGEAIRQGFEPRIAEARRGPGRAEGVCRGKV